MKELGSNAAILNEVKQPGKKMLFFSADWCSDCRFIKPAMPEIEKDFSDMGVFGIPSFIAFNDGKETGRFVNKDRKTKQQVEDFINGLH